MNKNYLITFGVSFLIMLTVAVIVFMLMLPKQSNVSKGTVTNYEQISKSEYTFEATKDITSEPLKKQYSISTEDMSEFKYTNQYTTGNTDPFAPVSGETSNSGSSGTTNTTTTNGTATKEEIEATNKTTNSNGGTANPPSTIK